MLYKTVIYVLFVKLLHLVSTAEGENCYTTTDQGNGVLGVEISLTVKTTISSWRIRMGFRPKNEKYSVSQVGKGNILLVKDKIPGLHL